MQHHLIDALRLGGLQSAFDGARSTTGSATQKNAASSESTGTDDVLAAAIAERLAAADDAEIDRVHVAVQRACVTLRGEVPSRRSMGRIEALIASCQGVMRIDNQMRVGYSH